MPAAKDEASVQASTLVIAALTWLVAAFMGAGAPAWALGGYLAAWFVLGKVPALRFSRAVLMLLSALVLVGAVMGRARLVDVETWAGAAAHLEDRARLRLPAIAPSMVFGDHPQTFYVALDAETSVRVRLGPRGATLPGVPLGHGLYRVSYDPRVHGVVAESDGPVLAQIITGEDDTHVSVSLHYVAPLAQPRSLCTAPSRTLAASPSLETDALYLVDDEGRVRSFDVGDGPSDCVFLDGERIAVAHAFGPTLWVMDTDGRVLRRLESPPATRLASFGETLAIAHAQSISLRNASTLELEATLDVADVDWLTFTTPTTLIVARRRAAELWRFRRNAGVWTHDAALPLGRPAVTMVRLDDSHVVISATDYVPSGEAHLGNHFVQDQLLTIDTELMRVTDQEITARRSPRQSNAGDVDRGLSPMALHVEDDALYVAFAGSDETWTLRDGELPDMRSTADIPAPEGITRLGGHLVVTSPSAGLIATQQSERDDEWRVVATGDEGEDSPRRRGRRAFYEGTRAGISCQSCHLHGDTDFVMRNIGGQRLAPTLGVGGLADTAPFLRDGSYPRIRDLQHLARTLFRGYLRSDARRGADIEAYVRALPRRPVPRVDRDEERERRGLDVFVQAECVTCHSFPAFTNLAQLPAGALFPEPGPSDSAGDEILDTPSLLSVGTHGPYLSDGRAQSLSAVFEDHNGSNRHGNTRALSDAELADLVYFLGGL
ncbi:MAG: hypothetical protein AB8H86_03190 [Polyangiales bacterium]